MTLFLKRLSKILSATSLRARLASLILGLFISLPLYSTPEQDFADFKKHYQQRFPTLKLNDFSNGIYAIDPIARQSWQAIEEFPPYDTAIDAGKKLFNTPFRNGKHYAGCFKQKGLGIANHYPLWDKATGEVITLPVAINHCRRSQHEAELPYDNPEMVNLTAYMAYTTRGKPIQVKVPKDDSRSIAAYEQGKAFYYGRRGQLNFACATCHIQNAGKKLRAEILSASLGHTNNWPTYRLKWSEIGSLHRRFAECLTNIKAESLTEQSVEFRNLEYFLSYMGNGVPISGPSTRK
jgi:L-cysteine S-thiosulfotransferase